MATFNLQKFLKKAYYEDAKELTRVQTRCMQNCYKSKLDSGMGHQEAIMSCIEEFGKDEWPFKYASTKK